MFIETTKQLLSFIEKSPTAFHAIENMKEILVKEGFQELQEGEHWELVFGGSYFVTRNSSSLIAFSVPSGKVSGFRVMASHSDSPTFKVKENPELHVENQYVKLNVEKYGGMLMGPWFDRPLSIAGRIVFAKDGDLYEKLVNIDRDLLMIPSLAIHMNREVNEKMSLNAQKDILPLYSMEETGISVLDIIAKEAGLSKEDILGHDLFLYSRVPGSIWGADQEFISSGRLDDLQCAYASLTGFLRAKREKNICLHCVLDNEEVGSTTRQGAASTFLENTLCRIYESLGFTKEEYLQSFAKSFMVSADNAHAVHPNYTDKTDPGNRPYLNGGIVIKYNANQKYCTDAVSAARFKQICKKADVPYQTFTNRSDMAGGSTLGNIANTKVAVSTVDIGLPQLAMHSPYETAGIKDTLYLCKAAEILFE